MKLNKYHIEVRGILLNFLDLFELEKIGRSAVMMLIYYMDSTNFHCQNWIVKSQCNRKLFCNSMSILQLK